MKRRKSYAHTRDPLTGKRVLAHRLLAEQQLGRPLLPREVVHHRDGDSLNNDLANLIVLPDQRFHAHVEFHSRRCRNGMVPLFPEYFQGVPESCGGLFDHVLVVPVKELTETALSPATLLSGQKPEALSSPSATISAPPVPHRRLKLVLPLESAPASAGGRYLAKVLAELKVRVRTGEKEQLYSLEEWNRQESD